MATAWKAKTMAEKEIMVAKEMGKVVLHWEKEPCWHRVLSSSTDGCNLCVAKAAAVNRLKMLGLKTVGRDSVETAAETRPDWVMRSAELGKLQAAGGSIVKVSGGVVTVRLPDSYSRRFLIRCGRTRLHSLSDDYIQKSSPSGRESLRADAVQVLWKIAREENVMAQIFLKGYAEIDVELVN